MCSSPFPSYLLICCHYLFILKKWKILSISLCLWITYTLWKLVLLHEFLIKILFPRYFENKNARLGFGSPSSLRYCSFFLLCLKICELLWNLNFELGGMNSSLFSSLEATLFNLHVHVHPTFKIKRNKKPDIALNVYFVLFLVRLKLLIKKKLDFFCDLFFRFFSCFLITISFILMHDKWWKQIFHCPCIKSDADISYEMGISTKWQEVFVC